MVKNILILTLTGIIITGCENKKSIKTPPETSIQKNDFFPVTQYLQGQLREMDSLPITPLKITTLNGISDSVWLKKKDIRLFALPFLVPVIDSAQMHNYFSEKSFLDQTINAFTFSFDPLNQLPDSMEIKRWDIYIDPGNSKVKRIFIVKQLNKFKTPQIIQLIWKSGYYCQITTITEKNDTPPEIKQEKLIWNFND
ncbi:MAG: hypothetical protein ABIO55_09000 [Ginsengibacter sp.]